MTLQAAAAALMANAIWVYSMTVSLGRDLGTGVTAGVLFFVPVGLFALGSTIYLWQRRALFLVKG